MINIVIPLRPITKKNHQQIRRNWKTGRRFIAPSPQYEQYEKDCGWHLKNIVEKAIEYPVNIKCLYYMSTRGRVDLTNLMESTHDVLVKHGVLKDDNSKIIISVDGSRVLYDKKNPRTEIYIEKAELDHKEVDTITEKFKIGKTKQSKGWKYQEIKLV